MMLFIKTISFTEMPLKFVNPRKRKILYKNEKVALVQIYCSQLSFFQKEWKTISMSKGLCGK